MFLWVGKIERENEPVKLSILITGEENPQSQELDLSSSQDLVSLLGLQSGQWAGIGTTGLSFSTVSVDSGIIKKIRILDHGEVEDFNTISDFAKHINMHESEVIYFMYKFYEWKKIQ
jgi:phage anti-repressor protein